MDGRQRECINRYQNGEDIPEDCFDGRYLKGVNKDKDTEKGISIFESIYEDIQGLPRNPIDGNNSIVMELINNNDIKVFNPNGTTTCNGTDHSHLSSLCHLLVIPNPTRKRIYNAVYLKKSDREFIKAMCSEGLYVARIQREYLIHYMTLLYNQHIGCTYQIQNTGNLIDWLETSSEGMFKRPGTSYKVSLEKNFSENDGSGVCVRGADLTHDAAKKFKWEGGEIKAPEPEWVIGFHVHPNHSVGLLHLHIMDKTLMTKDSEENYKKTVPIENIVFYD